MHRDISPDGRFVVELQPFGCIQSEYELHFPERARVRETASDRTLVELCQPMLTRFLWIGNGKLAMEFEPHLFARLDLDNLEFSVNCAASDAPRPLGDMAAWLSACQSHRAAAPPDLQSTARSRGLALDLMIGSLLLVTGGAAVMLGL